MTELEQQRNDPEELLDEESLAVLAILLAVSLEFGFGFAKTVDWWAGLVAGPAALATLVTLGRERNLVLWRTWFVIDRLHPDRRDGTWGAFVRGRPRRATIIVP